MTDSNQPTTNSSSGTADTSGQVKLTTIPQLLTRLSDLHQQPYLHSSRTRRACVAMILRIHPLTDSPYVQLKPPPPKVKKPPRPTTQPKPHATNTPPTSTNSSVNVVLTPPVQKPLPPILEPDILTRVVPPISPEESHSIRSALMTLAADPWTHPASGAQLELIFMQRAKNPNDRWSGQMSFPGGRQDKGETDDQTVVREVQEEIGWNLNDRTQFVKLGQLDDKPMDGLKNVKPLAVSVFVFLQICRESPPLILEPSEVAAILFVPISYFQSLRTTQSFGRIYHPLMLQILARGSSSNSSAKPPPAFDLKLIGWPHKREGRLMTRAGQDQLSTEQQRELEQLDAAQQQQHISELDELPFTPQTLLTNLRSKVQTLAHELPLPSIPALSTSLAQLPLPHLRPFLPSIEQLASLRFPALSLPGVWVDSEGRGGISTGDDIQTREYNLMIKANPPARTKSSSSGLQVHPISSTSTPSTTSSLSSLPAVCPPPFILWGMTLEKSCELLYFLGSPFPLNFFQRGSDWRKRQYQFWTALGEARWGFERRMKRLNTANNLLDDAATRTDLAAAVAAAPLQVSAFAPTQTSPTIGSSASNAVLPLTPSPYSSPVILTRVKQRVREAWEQQKLKLRSRL